MRTETPRIVRVDLQPRTPRFREDQFRDLFGPTSPVTPTVAPGQPSAPVVPGASGAPAAPRDSARTAAPRRPVFVAFDDIRLRASMLPTQGLGVGDMAVSPDGRTLVFVGSAGGLQQIYAWSLDELARETTLRALTTSAGNKSELQWSADSRELWYLEGGRISAVVVESRAARTVAATAEVDVNFAAEKQAIFRQAWTFLGRNFFDERMNGVDWPALATKIAPYVEGSRTPDDLRRVLSLMIGELNASHLGISGPTPGAVSIPVARLGVRFDRAALERDGSLVVSEVIAQGPAAVANVRLGERIAQECQRPRRHAEYVEVNPRILFIQDTQHDTFTRAARQGGHTHVEHFAAKGQPDAPVLRNPAFGDVEARHHLDAADDDGGYVRGHPERLAQHAVDAHTHDQAAFIGLDMDVGHALPDGFGDDTIDKADRRRIVGRVE
jgi:hypothetical protein